MSYEIMNFVDECFSGVCFILSFALKITVLFLPLIVFFAIVVSFWCCGKRNTDSTDHVDQEQKYKSEEIKTDN